MYMVLIIFGIGNKTLLRHTVNNMYEQFAYVHVQSML